MKKVKYLFLLMLFPYLSANSQTEYVEMILKSNGNMVEAHSQKQILTTWAHRIIRGTSGKPYYLFIDSLYGKYFYRIIKTATVFRDTVPPAGMNFRQHQSDSNILRAFDFEKVSIEDNLTQVWIDILNTSIADSMRNDELEAVPEWERWEYGTIGRKVFTTMRYDNLTQAQVDSYLTEIDTIIVIPGQVEPDTTRRIPRLKIETAILKDSLMVLGKCLDVLTIGDLARDGTVSQQLKDFFANNITGKGTITQNTTIFQLLTIHRGKVPLLFMRHPLFTPKSNQRVRWLKKR